MPIRDTEPPDITTMSDEELAKQLYIHTQSKRTKPAAWATLSDFQKDDWDNLADYVRTLFAPPATPPTRIPIAISSDYSGDTVICDDGTIWRRVPPLHINWTQLPPIPQPDAPRLKSDQDAAEVGAIARHHGSSGRIAATPEPIRDRANLLQVAKIARWRLQNYNLRADVWKETADWLTAAIDREEAAVPDPLRDVASELLKVMYHCAAYFDDQLERSEAAKTPPRVEHITMSNMCDRAIAKAEGRNL